MAQSDFTLFGAYSQLYQMPFLQAFFEWLTEQLSRNINLLLNFTLMKFENIYIGFVLKKPKFHQ
jgi:hypothetical protein